MHKYLMTHNKYAEKQASSDPATPPRNGDSHDPTQQISSPEQPLPDTEHGLAWHLVRHELRHDWHRIMNEHANTGGNKADLTTPYHMSWDKAEPAIRFGYDAAYRYRHRAWSYGLGSNRLDRQLESEWQQLRPGEPWQRVRPLVYRGWVRALIVMR